MKKSIILLTPPHPLPKLSQYQPSVNLLLIASKLIKSDYLKERKSI